ncbi:MAG: tRNA (N(6)-L-threonylcarbamoyladenosine(37)-C(2))-methylthiotransferase MtaB [Thermodesulfovibrionales bacterium]|jgi:threonylcarbamoyladenosine tRNA methylthiotransferase MtaB
MKIAIVTLGCRTNQAEMMGLEHSLLSQGHRLVDLSDEPDLCIINTCTVTSGADHQSRQFIKRAAQGSRAVIVTGCFGELNREELERMPGEIRFVHNIEKQNIVNQIESITSSDTEGIALSLPSETFQGSKRSRQRSIVKVQDGCNYSCSYCAIPLARGRSRSLPLHEIIGKIIEYESMGYKEVVLTGIHLGTYGMDLSPQKGLSHLIEEILTRTAIPRIRLSSLEVREIDARLLDLFQDQRLCSHLHVPLQSGDDNILKSMNRLYSSQDFLRSVDEIFSRVPDIGLGTDVIVGFPGEGEVEFGNTRRILEFLPFSYLHIFPYSPRPKTRAALFPKQVPGNIKKERATELRALGEEKRRRFIRRHEGKILDFIVEGGADSGWSGTTGNYIKVMLVAAEELQPGMLVNGRIARTEKGEAAAEVIFWREPSQL